jgi:hypothetical protein
MEIEGESGPAFAESFGGQEVEGMGSSTLSLVPDSQESV